MVLKFGEIYIYHDQKEEYFSNSIFRFFGYETYVDKPSKILMIFDDNNELFDVNEYLNNINNSNALLNELTITNETLPESFVLTNGKKATHKKNIIVGAITKQCFKQIFTNYKKYKTVKGIPSIYNCIYKYDLEEIFGILRISSAEETPRFIFAFDDKLIDNQQAVYLINYIFRGGKL